jgi:hypothetical protein
MGSPKKWQPLVRVTIFLALGMFYCFCQWDNNLYLWDPDKGRSRRVEVPLVFGSVARAGSTYGGWGYLPNLLTSDSIVYSVGFGGDMTWDSETINRHCCRVFGFDNTPVHMQYGRIF